MIYCIFPLNYWGSRNSLRTIWLWISLPWHRVWHINRCWPLFSNARVTNSPGLQHSLFCCYCSVTKSWITLCNPMDFSTLGLSVLHQLPELAQTHVHWVGDAIQPSHLLSSPSPPAFNLSQHGGLFKWVSSAWVDKVLEFQLQHQSYQWTTRIDLFGIDWLDLLALQVTLKSLLQHHSSKASVLRCSAFFILQISHPYTTTGKTIALTRQTSVDKVMSLFFFFFFKF